MIHNGKLELSGGNGDYASTVFLVVRDGRSIVEEREIGKVIPIKGWCFDRSYLYWLACDMNGANHGDRYVDKWSAAHQLRLGLGL